MENLLNTGAFYHNAALKATVQPCENVHDSMNRGRGTSRWTYTGWELPPVQWDPLASTQTEGPVGGRIDNLQLRHHLLHSTV